MRRMINGRFSILLQDIGQLHFAQPGHINGQSCKRAFGRFRDVRFHRMAKQLCTAKSGISPVVDR